MVEAFMSLRRLVLFLCAAAVLAVASPAHAEERRIALVVGNGAYANIRPLRNPVNDASVIRDTLTRLGFEVIYRENVDKSGMERAVGAFSARLFEAGPEGVGLFYFAGHGVQSGGENFLLPVDVSIQRETDLRLGALRAGDVLAQMEGAGSAVKIVILDACRDNPFAESFRGMRNSQGLAMIGLGNTEFFVAYAATAGNVAEDGSGANSPYATALARRLPTTGADLETAFRLVRIDVSNTTGNRQLPEATSTMRRQFFFRPGTLVASAPPVPPAARPARPSQPPRDFNIAGQWCETSRGRSITMNITEQALVYTLDRARSTYAVRAIRRRDQGVIEVEWINRGEPIVLEFGEFSADGNSMTQLRGRSGAGAWRDYGIRLQRC
jgi:Caspase domain